MTHKATVLAKPAPKRVLSPGPAVAMNRTTQLRIQKAHVNGLEQHRSPFKAQTRQINNTIRSRIEIFEKNENQVPPEPRQVPAPKKDPIAVIPNKVPLAPLNGEKETVIVKNVISKWQGISEKAASPPEVRKYQNVVTRQPSLAISVSPWTSSGQVVTDSDSKQAEVLLAERRKLLDSRKLSGC